MRKLKRALVLGGSGFIGHHLIQALLDQEHEVTCLIHSRPLPATFTDQVQVILDDIGEVKWEAIDPVPDVIFHLVRIHGANRSGRIQSAQRLATANQRLIQWLQQRNHPPLLVYVTGTLGYGSHPNRITEDTALNPVSYSKEYSIGDYPVLQRAQIPSHPIMIMRAAWVYGSGSWFHRYFLTPIQQTKKVPVYGSGSNWMSLIHVTDCARMINFLAKQGPVNETFNLFCGSPIQQSTLAAQLSNLIGEIPIQKLPFWKVRLKYGQGVRDAFRFSLKVGTKHTELYKQFQFQYPRLEEGLAAVLSGS